MVKNLYEPGAAGSLISLAAWLRREAASATRAADSAADPYGRQISLDAAARLEHASEVVKEVADQERKSRATDRFWPKRA